MLPTVVTSLLLASGALAHPGHGHGHDCAPLRRGNFNISRYQLYPENADWDDKACLVYFGYVPASGQRCPLPPPSRSQKNRGG